MWPPSPAPSRTRGAAWRSKGTHLIDRLIRLVVVDDEVALVHLLLRHLQRQPAFEVTGFACPEKALACLQQQTTDVLITDVRMGAMDGPELARRAREHLPDLGVIFTTAKLREDISLAGIPFQYVSKPFDPGQLILAIYRSLPGGDR